MLCKTLCRIVCSTVKNLQLQTRDLNSAAASHRDYLRQEAQLLWEQELKKARRAHENSAAHSAQIISLSDKILLADAVLMKKETEEMKTKNNNQISEMQELNLHLHQQLSEPLAQVSKLESD